MERAGGGGKDCQLRRFTLLISKGEGKYPLPEDCDNVHVSL